MAVINRLSLRSSVAECMYRSTRGMGRAAQTFVDMDVFAMPMEDVDGPDGGRGPPDGGRGPQWVFLGCPGVGKGTYASRLSKALEIPHIAMGDIVRQELKGSSDVSKQLSVAMNEGKLLPDEVIFKLLSRRLEQGLSSGERGFILDGFPRTISQADALDDIAEIDLVVNLRLREDAIISKCLGRRICSQCGGNFNLAKIDIEGTGRTPRIFMPPLLPPPSCAQKMTIRADDTDEVVRKRLRIYNEESAPVEGFYRKKGTLLDFDVGGGVPETWPNLLAALNIRDKERSTQERRKKLVANRGNPVQ